MVERVREVADGLDDRGSSGPASALLEDLDRIVLPHECTEEEEVVPAMTRITGIADAVGAINSSHAGIERHVVALHRLLDTEDADDECVVGVRRTFHGLCGLLRLHNAMEEENTFALLEH